MTETANSAPTSTSGSRDARLWCGVLLAPTAWVVMELVGYYLASRACGSGGGIHAAGPDNPVLVNILLALVLSATAGIGLAMAISTTRVLNSSHAPVARRELFMAQAGVVGSAIFLGGILLFGLPALFVNVCQHARV